MISQMLFTGSALWTPTQLTTQVWLDAADAATITLVGSNVSQINDKSGNGRNFSQATALLRPLLVNNASNGLPALQTDGTNFLTSTINLTGLFQNVTDATIVNVAKYPSAPVYVNNAISTFVSNGTTASGARFALTPSAAATNNLGLTGRRNDADVASMIGSSTARSSITNTVIIEIGNIIYSSAVANHYTNGTQDLTSAAFLTSGSTQATPPLNASIFKSGTGTFVLPAGCQLFEVLMFNSTLSTSDRQKLEGYFAWKWGTVASLPAGHPYKNSPPYI